MTNERYWLTFTLKSDAAFGRGDGVVGLVDSEVEHDEDGLPYLRGRTLKGLLFEKCKNILFALNAQNAQMDQWQTAQDRLFGCPGSTWKDEALLHIGDARLPELLRQAVRHAISCNENKLTPTDILESLTDIRRQTAIDETSGAPEKASLRAMRVVRCPLSFEATLTFLEPPEDIDLPLLAACVLAFRRAGTARNRGRGRLCAFLCDAEGENQTQHYFKVFAQSVKGEAKT